VDNLYRIPRNILPHGSSTSSQTLIRHGYEFRFPPPPPGAPGAPGAAGTAGTAREGERPRACFLINSPGMSAFYRCYLPARELARLAHWQTWIGSDQWREPLLPTLERAQVIVLHAPHDLDLLTHVRRLARQTLIVVDLDDCLGEIPLANPAHGFWRKRWEALRRYLEVAHVVTCPSPGLMEWLQPHCRHVELVPNFLDLSNPLWKDPGELVEPRERWIGFFGSYSHLHDLSLLAGPLERVLHRCPETRFALMGTIELYHALALPEARRVWIPTRPHDRFMTGVRLFTVGLAPLQETCFNRCKSPLKVLEYLAAGVYPIASAVEPFLTLGKQLAGWARQEGWQGETLLPLVSGEEGWVEAMGEALDYTAAAQERFGLLQRYVEQYCGSEQLMMLAGLYPHWYRQHVVERSGPCPTPRPSPGRPSREPPSNGRRVIH
jgi:glycosyltransferase involved in cell wall biosynthesis